MSQQGLLTSAVSLTNLSSEPDYSLQRWQSASEVLEASSTYRIRSKPRQRARDVRHYVADSSSDYYTSRRPQSLVLNSQAPAYSILQPTTSVPALTTISENEMLDYTSARPHDYDGYPEDSVFLPERTNTPLFRYTPTPVMEPTTPLSRPTTPQVIAGQPRAMTPQVLGGGTPLPGHNGWDNPTPVPIHSSEPVTREFVPLYLNPQTGQVYSHDDGFFMPVANQDELLAKPPKPDKRSGEGHVQKTYTRFTLLLATLFCMCGDVIVLAACSIPALLCIQKVHQKNLQRSYQEAKKYSEYVLCFNILGIVIHVLLMLVAILTAVLVGVFVASD